MKLKNLYLKNFRCFDELTLDFGKRLTVIIAENGAGKTAILDAISLGFARYLTKIPGVKGHASKETDLRVLEDERKAPFMLLAWKACTHDAREIIWSSERKRDASINAAAIRQHVDGTPFASLLCGVKAMDEFALEIIQAESEAQPFFLPVIAYYGTNRAIREEVQRRRGFRRNFSRFDALHGALEPDSRFRAAFEWFNALEDEERRERETRRDFDYRHPALEVVRNAIGRVLPGHKNPRTEIRPLRFVIDKAMPDGSTSTLRITQLSDGYRVVLGLVMDLARRMVEANTGRLPAALKNTNPLDLPAIALIDEVDLHLHPRWQQRIVTDLMQTFTNTQFILTTHSPQVLSTVKRENVRIIGRDNEDKMIAARPIAATYGEPSGDVLHSVMMVDPQPPVAEKNDLQRLTELVDQGRFQDEEAQILMAALQQALGETHPQLLRLQRSIERQKRLQS
ncbi:hypothetical protein CO613_05155 [Lysobacteraceae bacterium NML07-0707]|nr:hypothetical protein CO613_05155 [Xanthomonadaceae bacterium NML07-0707]